MPLWKILIVLIAFPGCYILYSLTPWSIELFSRSNADYFIPFFCGLIALHWGTYLVCYRLMISTGWKNENVGLILSRKEMAKGVGIYLLIAIGILMFVEAAVRSAGLDTEKLRHIGDFFPKTTTQRVLFIITAFSAGFCEEFVYRGFGIRALESRKVNTWLVLLITSISFTFVHGIVAFQRFPAYFIPGLIFGFLFVWRKTLTLPIFVHALIDLGGIMMVLRALNS